MTQDDLALRIARLRPGPSADCAGRCRTRTGGISETLRARPIQAAWASAGSFAMGAVLPLWSLPWPRRRVDPFCVWDFTAVPRASRRAGCTRGWRKSDNGRNPRHLLGCARNGDHLRRRMAVRNSCVRADNRKQARSCAFLKRVPSKQRVPTIKPGLHGLHEKEIGHRKKRNCRQQRYGQWSEPQQRSQAACTAAQSRQ